MCKSFSDSFNDRLKNSRTVQKLTHSTTTTSTFVILAGAKNPPAGYMMERHRNSLDFFMTDENKISPTLRATAAPFVCPTHKSPTTKLPRNPAIAVQPYWQPNSVNFSHSHHAYTPIGYTEVHHTRNPQTRDLILILRSPLSFLEYVIIVVMYGVCHHQCNNQ